VVSDEVKLAINTELVKEAVVAAVA
jgi:hypothetical protein